MARVTNAVAARKRTKRLLKKCKGFYGDRKNHLKLSKDALMSAQAFNYRSRKVRKSEFRGIWITRLSAASKLHGISYSKFVHGLKEAGCQINRKCLSEMAIHNPAAFGAVVAKAKSALV